MVFTGDWNGGERVFRLEPHHALDLKGVTRNGVPLTAGDLAYVDHYALNGNVLRWRARAPDDPPFDKQEIIYAITYTLGRALLPHGDRYRLHHDFAFGGRPGAIENFALQLELGSDWRSGEGRVIRREAGPLPPGSGYVVTLELDHVGEAAPATISVATALMNRYRPWMILGLFGSTFLLFLLFDTMRDALTGIDTNAIDTAWIQRNLTSIRPEVVAAIYHGDVGPPAFAAILSKLEQDRKIRTWMKGSNLFLELLVNKESLSGAERTVVDNLFATRKKINTEMIRSENRRTGFDPPGLIRKDVLAEAKKVTPFGSAAWGCLAGLPFFIGGMVMSIMAWRRQPSDIVAPIMILVGSIIVSIAGTSGAKAWARSRSLMGLVAVAAVPFVAHGVVKLLTIIGPNFDTPWFGFTDLGLFGLAVGLLGTYIAILAEATGPLSLHTARIRKTLRKARRFFVAELSKPAPALQNQWTPWMVALGLDRSIASWWKSTQKTVTTGRSDSTDSPSTSFSSTSSSSSTSFAGGGGAFGGAGSTVAWSSAAMALSTPMRAPSSSSGGSGSSSSSSSSSSSGGGSGGGW